MRAVRLAILGLAPLAACATVPEVLPGSGCDANDRCVVAGVLTVNDTGRAYRGGRLSTSDGRCIPIVLSDRTIDEGRWTGRRVVVEGHRFDRAEGLGILSIQYGDRWLVSGMCPPGPMVIYADRISRGRAE